MGIPVCWLKENREWTLVQILRLYDRFRNQAIKTGIRGPCDQIDGTNQHPLPVDHLTQRGRDLIGCQFGMRSQGCRHVFTIETHA